MRLSSIFNFDTYQARFRLSYWPIFLLALMLAAEIVLRLPVVIQHLPDPEPTLWHAELIPSKLKYLKLAAEEPGIDVLFMGNSTMQAGVNPYIFDEVRAKTINAGPGRAAFNASIEGLPPSGNLIFLQIYLRYAKPHTIIYGVTPQDLNTNSPWAKDVTDRVKHSPAALAESKWGVRGHFIATVLETSALYRYRFVLHRLLLRGGKSSPSQKVYFNDRGYDPIERRLSDVPPANRGVFYNRAGVLNYSTIGEQQEALRTLITYALQNDIELILVNMPLADDYYGNFDSREDYQSYLAALTKLATDFEVPLWDIENLSSPEAFKDHHFADFNHLNKEGAEKLSRLLAQEYSKLTTLSSKDSTW